jgi:hypothetical protein
MEEFDYYEVMEQRIRYFSQKYDPQNKFKPAEVVVKRKVSSTPLQPPFQPIEKQKITKKILVGLDTIISVFL